MTEALRNNGPQKLPWAGRFSRPMVRHRYAVGDIHGCCRTLRRMVEEELRLQKEDTLYLLGDYIDRGPDGRGVLDYLLQLWKDDYDIRPLLGNHEEMLLGSASGAEEVRRLWIANGGDATLRQFEVARPAEIPRRYLDFLSMLPRILTTGDYVLVHAGLDFRCADPVHDTSPMDMLWERYSQVDPAKLEGRTLLCGHTMTPLHEILASLPGSQICLDNGCCLKGMAGYGNLVALDMDARRLIVVENCD